MADLDNTNTDPVAEPEVDISGAGEALMALFDAEPTTAETTEQEEETPTVTEGETVNPVFDSEPQAEEVSDGAQQVTAESLNQLQGNILGGLRDILQNSQSETSEGEQSTTEEPPVEENPLMDSDAFMEKFTENPVKAIQELAESIADKKVAAQMEKLTGKLQPVLKQSEMLGEREKGKVALTEFLGTEGFEDAVDYSEGIANYILEKGLPKDEVNSYREAYHATKSNALSANKPLDEYLTDETELEKITQNQAVKDKVIAQYLKDVAQGGKPATIGDSGHSSASTPNEIITLEDANAALKRKLNQ